MTPAFKTRAEQRLDWLAALNRPLSDDESDELRRSLHAVYTRNWKQERSRRLAQHRNEELALLAKMEREMDG